VAGLALATQPLHWLAATGSDCVASDAQPSQLTAAVVNLMTLLNCSRQDRQVDLYWLGAWEHLPQPYAALGDSALLAAHWKQPAMSVAVGISSKGEATCGKGSSDMIA
jgi:hypothetical protein